MGRAPALRAGGRTADLGGFVTLGAFAVLHLAAEVPACRFKWGGQGEACSPTGAIPAGRTLHLGRRGQGWCSKRTRLRDCQMPEAERLRVGRMAKEPDLERCGNHRLNRSEPRPAPARWLRVRVNGYSRGASVLAALMA